MEIKTILAFCSKKEAYIGKTIERDFEKFGKHSVKFFVSKKIVGVEVNGFSSDSIYVFNSKSRKDEQRNAYFISRFIDTCDNSEPLKMALGL